MRPRDRLIDQFSTFALLDRDRFQRWIGDPRLARSMQQQLANTLHPTTDDRIWAICWYRQLTHPLAQLHLRAYLQEVCYWIAIDMTRKLTSSQYTPADYFQIANIEIPRVFKSFNPDRNNSLKIYAKLVLTNTLKDLLRQRQVADMCSDWSLLRKVSKKRVGEVLLQQGIVEPEADRYQFAWFCFKTVYVPPERNSQRLPPPDPIVWSKIVELYHTKRQHQLVSPSEVLTVAQMEVQMTKLAKWIRSYLYPAIDSLNRSKLEPGTGEIQDDLTDTHHSESLLDLAIEQEDFDRHMRQQSELETILTQSLANLRPELREILQLFYRDGLSQQELAERLQISQPTISRRIKTAESQLLTALLAWIETQLNKLPDPNELKDISTNLRAWLIDKV
jgi:RNA polymerase sigma factor (sigma-70 family)